MLKNTKHSIKKYIVLFILLFYTSSKGQDQLYYNLGSSGSNVAEFYKINADSSISYSRYRYTNGKEEISTGVEKNMDNDAWKRFLNNGKPVSLIKTDTPENFQINMMHKNFSVERYGEKTSWIFYGNSIIEGTPPISRNMRLLYSRNNMESFNRTSNYYKLKEINGIYFFIYQGEVYLLQHDKILENLFPDAKITTITSSSTGNTAMASLLMVKEYNNMYGVSDNMGKTILPSLFQNVLICTDAILAKKNDKWYFYDFFGKQISKKGYRKILPLSIVDVPILVDQIQIKEGAALKYVVLDGKDLKIIDDIYKESKDSKFVFQYGELSICGTRTGSYISQSANLQLNDDKIVIKEKTYFQNYPFTDLDYRDNHFQTEKTQEMMLNPNFGKLEFLDKEDAFSSYGYMNNQWICY